MTGRPGAALLLAVLPAFAAGCGYLRNRGLDFADILSPGVSLGPGMGARISATRLLAVEVMVQKDEAFAGFRGRKVESSYGVLFASWRMPTIYAEKPLPRRWYDLFTTSRRRMRFPGREEVEDRRHTLFITSGVNGQRLLDVLDFEVGLSAVAGGVELAVRPGEMLDFLVGLVGLDVSRDDGGRDLAADDGT